MKKIVFGAVLSGIILCSQLVSAQTRTPGINQKQANQEARIHQGVRNGDLTRREATRLQMQQARIRGMKQMAKSDGVVTRRERATIARAQNRASDNIYRERHNVVHR